jgi:hypothetical protein
MIAIFGARQARPHSGKVVTILSNVADWWNCFGTPLLFRRQNYDHASEYEIQYLPCYGNNDCFVTAVCITCDERGLHRGNYGRSDLNRPSPLLISVFGKSQGITPIIEVSAQLWSAAAAAKCTCRITPASLCSWTRPRLHVEKTLIQRSPER